LGPPAIHIMGAALIGFHLSLVSPNAKCLSDGAAP
jgi:hypothetical protein